MQATKHSPAAPNIRYRVGFRGLQVLNAHLAPLNLAASEAYFDKLRVMLHCLPGEESASHEIVPLQTRPQKESPGRQISAVVLCGGTDPGQHRTESPLAISLPDLIKSLFFDALLQPAEPNQNQPGRLDRFYRNPSHASDWWKFHYPRGLNHGVEFGLGDRYALVHHSTLECFGTCFSFVPSLDLFNDEPFKPPSPANKFATLITHRDILTGQTQARLEATVTEAAAGDFDGILVRTTCLPDMVGDSPVHLLEALRERLGVSGHWLAKTHPTPNAVAIILQERLDALASLPAGPEPFPVVLAGVESKPLANELAQLLELLGLTVIENLLPNLTLQDVGRRGMPKACVWANSFGWGELLTDQLLSTIPVVRTFPPFGLEGSRQWLMRIGQALQLPDVEQNISQATDDCVKGLSELRQETSKFPVALVGDSEDVAILSGRSPYSGYSLLALLTELGFPVSLLLYRPQESDLTPLPIARVPILEFRDQKELQTLLGDFPLAYSDFSVDRRLLSSGVAGFGGSLFDPGFQGLLRAGRLLLHRAQHRPFQDWKPQLSSVWRATQ